MELLLIQPAISKEKAFTETSQRELQPLAPAVLSALTPGDVSVSFLDDRFEEVSYADSPDLVGISTTTFTAKRAYEIAQGFRERKIPVILGGHHVKLETEEALSHCSSVVVGEAEGLWPEVISDFQHGDLKRTYQLEELPDLASTPVPDREIFRGKDYLPIEMVETTRGCPNNCSFCSVSAFFGRGYRHRPIRDVVEEIAGLDRKLIFFVDDNIVGDFDYAKNLFRELRRLNVRWFGQAAINMARDEKLLTLMRRSGCLGNLIGFESLDGENLKSINKSWNRSLPYEESVDIIHGKGLGIFASFITGLDGDDPETIERTYEFAMRKKFLAANFNVLTPYPGTQLFEQMKESGRLTEDRWWLSDDPFKVRFVPNNFDGDELVRESFRIKREFYRYRNVFRRATNWKPVFSSPYNFLLYVIMNKALHKEQEKVGQELKKAKDGGR